MVDYTTRVILKLDFAKRGPAYKTAKIPTAEDIQEYGRQVAERADRAASIMRILAANGFTFSYVKKDICADSSRVEAQQVKKMLRSSGVEDWEYQIYLEYYRQWGIL